MKRFLSLILVIALMAACMIPAAAARVYADEAPLSRKEVAVIIADLLNVEFEPYMAEEVSIADVTPDIDGYEAIILCVYLEIMGGYPDGCFKPERMLTRAELAVFLCNAAEVDTADLVYEPRPMDVPEGAWYYQWMSGVLQNGFMSVDSNGCFRPDQTAYLSDINMTTLRKVMSAEFLFDAATGTITGYRGKDSIVTIPAKIDGVAVTTIAGMGRQNAVTQIVIPASVTAVRGNAFGLCWNLESFRVDSKNQTFRAIDGVLFSKDGKTLIRFPRGKAGDYAVPDGVTQIAELAFCDVFDVPAIVLPAGVETIGRRAFENCGLTDIELPHTLKTVGQSAFEYCSDLSDVWFAGSADEWNQIDITEDGNDYLFDAAIHCIGATVEPPVISAAVSADHIDVTWNAVFRATKYALYRRANESGSWGSWVLLSNTLTETAYADPDIELGVKYQYRAKAYRGAWSDYSNRAEAVIPAPVPDAPVISVNAAPGKNIISWDAVEYATEYTIYRRANETGSWSEWGVISTQSGTEYVDKAVKTDGMYEYRVKAGGKGGWSSYSNREKVTAKAPVAPAAPAISVSATAEKVTVQWQAVPDAGKYQIYRREKSDGKWNDWEIKYSAKGLVFNDKDVTGGVVYQYRAKAVNTDADPVLKSSYSNREMIGLAKPDAPVIRVSTAVGENTITWNAVSGAKYYVVYWRDKESGDWSAWSMSEPWYTPAYVHPSLVQGVEYQYRVRANNGVWSEYSNRVSVTAK